MISICFILLLLISILTSCYGQVTCASGWVQYGGSCYLINPVFNSNTIYGTWDQCNAYCTTASYPGATMLCVNDAAEDAWMYSQYGRDFWIGYTDMLPYGGGKGTRQYGWVTGCSSTYTHWGAGEPNNSGGQDHAFVNGGNSGLWDDHSPQAQLYCGCQYKPVLTMTSSSGPTSSPTATPSFRPSVGDVHE